MLQKGVWKKTSFFQKTNIVSSIFADNTFRPQLLSVFSPVFISEPISRLSEFICSRIGYYLLSFRNISLLVSHQTLTLSHWLLKFLDLIELSEQKGSWRQCIISRLLTPSLKPLPSSPSLLTTIMPSMTITLRELCSASHTCACADLTFILPS